MFIEGQLHACVYVLEIKSVEIHYVICGNVLQLFIQLHYTFLKQSTQ